MPGLSTHQACDTWKLLQDGVEAKHKAHTSSGQLSFNEKLRQLLAPSILLFLFKATLMGFGMGTFESFMCATVTTIALVTSSV